jgi:hypothetical protein
MATRTVTVRTASAGTLAQVPDVVNHQQESALATLGTAGFESRVKAAPASEAAGVVVKESPAAGRKVRRGSAIALLVSLGKAKPRRLATRPRAERFEARQNRGAGDTHRRRPGFAYRVRRLGGCRRPSHLAEPRRRSQRQARHRGAPRGFAASLALSPAAGGPRPGQRREEPRLDQSRPPGLERGTLHLPRRGKGRFVVAPVLEPCCGSAVLLFSSETRPGVVPRDVDVLAVGLLRTRWRATQVDVGP